MGKRRVDHTPGPWALNDRHIAGIRRGTDRLRPIATAAWARGTHVGEARANARLIAAAPSLLTELQALVAQAEAAGIDCAQARETIKQAGG